MTRGDGSVGDDITANAKKMKGVQAVLKESPDFTGGVRGEVIMTHSVHKQYFSDKANCRNAANGLMKRKDGEKSEYLCLITYDALSTDGPNPFADEEQKIAWLVKNGFESVPLKICKSAQEVIDYRASVMEIRPGLEYDIDGLVVKERTINLDDASRARPDRQIAFKFSLEEAVSVVRDVEWSENGATYTPVAIFDPVQLAGTTVQRASLANPDTLRKLGVQIGSHVVVVKRGEIIPKIVGLVPHPDDDKNCSAIKFPKKCSACGSDLLDTPSRLYCLSDIYSLTEEILTPYFLNEESIQKEKDSLGAKNVVASIKSKTRLSLAQFVAGFDIEGIGESMVEKVIEGGFDSLEKMLAASASDFENVYGFAQITAAAFAQGLAENADEMRALVASGAVTIKEAKGGALAGKSFCFTGELKTMKRADAEALVKEKGGSAKSSVTKDLTYLVTNDKESGSGKNAKAAKFGISIINEEEFLKLVK